jgi:hypothetical protein
MQLESNSMALFMEPPVWILTIGSGAEVGMKLIEVSRHLPNLLTH